MLPFPIVNGQNDSSATNRVAPAKKTHIRWFILPAIVIILPLFLIALHIQPTETYSYQTKLLEEMENAKTFDDFTKALFQYEVTSDSITTAYTLKNTKTRNIPALEPKLTSFSYDEYLQESQNGKPDQTTLFALECLSHHSEQNLSEKEKLTYSLLNDYLNNCLSLSNYPFYESLLGSTSGIQANLPVTLGEYPLRDETDVETYLQLLTQIPAYFEDVISYEEKRCDLGYETPAFVTAEALDSTKTMTTGFQNGDNSFIDTFNERITQVDSLSKKDIAKYKKMNQTYVAKYVMPAYEKLVKYLENALAEDELAEDISYGICSLPKGKEYYTHLAQYSTGSKKTIEAMISMTDQALSNALGTILNTALVDQEAYFYYCEHPLESYYQSPEAMLDSLSLMIREDYPQLKETPTYEIKTVSDSLASSLSPAFYMIPAIDDYKNNTIYINPLFTNEENGNLFPTLAHEGFPGHLYQTVYFNETNPSDIRQILNYLGYVEGWATYVEIDSLSFLEYPLEGDALCELYQADIIINLALSARIDMGVNYEGWTLNDTKAFFEKQGFDSCYAQDVYTYVVEAPASYLSYFIGYLEIMDIKDAFKRQELENYSEKEFHKKMLDVGPGDFETVREYVLKN